GLGITPSSWILVCGLMLTLFLGFGKRRAEMLLQDERGGAGREVLNAYSPVVLDLFLGISASSTILSYALYSVADDTTIRYGEYGMLWTVPFVVYGVLRYLYVLHEQGR